MAARVVGVASVLMTCLAVSKVISNAVWLFRVRPDPKGRKEGNAVITFKISDLPHGKRLGTEEYCEIHMDGSLPVEKNKTVKELEMPNFHLVNGRADISNLFPLIEKKLTKTETMVDRVENPVEDSHKCNLITTKEIPGPIDKEITVIGYFDGLRFNPKTVYLYHDVEAEDVFYGAVKAIAGGLIGVGLWGFIAYRCLA